ncbi:hypothetical protein ACNOYE_18470 [Nannocystaceae bacterium ST9]
MSVPQPAMLHAMIHLRVRSFQAGLWVASMLVVAPGCDGDEGEAELVGDEVAGTDTETETDASESSDTESTSETSGESEGTETTETTSDTSDSSETGEPLSFAADVYPIIMAECSCHVMNAPGQLPMPNAAAAYANLVDVASVQVGLDRVEPGDPDASHLFKKITATQTFGKPMPTLPPLLAADQVAVFEAWIAGGALE